MKPSLYLQSLFWGHSLGLRTWARRLRGLGAAAKYRLHRLLGRRPASVVTTPERPSPWNGDAPEPIAASLSGPARDGAGALREAIRLVAATEPVSFILVGRGAPIEGFQDPRPVFPRDGETACSRYLVPNTAPVAGVAGKTLPWLPDGEPDRAARPVSIGPYELVGSYLVEPSESARRRRLPWREPHRVLASLPVLDGPPTLLFLLPFLAVGGAERLLYDLLAGLADRYRLLVVTLEPHQRRLGQTVPRCAAHTPWIFTLGDWLPREAHVSALCHLIRRFSVQSLMSWNGTVLFYDHVPALRRAFPELRILHQLYHFEGGWTARTSPSVVAAVDGHVAVNHPIERSLVDRLGIDPGHVTVIHHGVPLAEDDEDRLAPRRAPRETLRETLRETWGLPADGLVAGTFIRLHAQKRPMDLLELARRFTPDELWLVVMGDGPLSSEVAQELDTRPIPNLVRIPMQSDPLPFYSMIDICLMASDYEGLPVFLLDGAARGLPGVAPAVGDIPLLFETGGGRCSAEPGDLDALEKDLRFYLDAEARLDAGRQARRRVEQRFGLDTYVAAYEAVLTGRTVPEETA